jgi:hypothetical protein
VGWSRKRLATELQDLVIVLHGHSLQTDLGPLVESALDTLYSNAGITRSVTVFEEVIGNADYTGGSGDIESPSLLDAFEADVDAHFVVGADNRVVTQAGMIAINDLARSAATTYANLQSYIAEGNSFRGGLWRFYPVTIVDTTEYDSINPHGSRGDLEPTRDAFDDLLIAGSGNEDDFVNARLSSALHKPRPYSTSIPRPPGGNAAYVTANFSDGIHLASGGKTALSQLIANKMFAVV